MSQSRAGLEASRALRRAYGHYRAYLVVKSPLALRDVVVRDAMRRKYNPNQPRVPAGNPDGGQWTDGGGSGGAGTRFPLPPGAGIRLHDDEADSGERIRVAQVDDPNVVSDVPPRPRNLPRTIQELSDIPKEKPASTKLKNAIIKFVAYRMAEIVAVRAALRGGADELSEKVALRVRLVLLGARIAPWVADEGLPRMISYYDPPKTLKELQDAVSRPRAGTQVHHIVERNSEQPGEKARIHSRENEVRIPEFKHHEITSWYMKKNEEFDGLPPREYLQDKDWVTRRQVGIGVLIDKGVMKP